MKRLQQFVYALALALGLAAAVSAEPAVPFPVMPKPSHAKAIREILSGLRVPELAIMDLRNEKIAPEKEEFARYFSAHISHEDIYQHMIPVYAKYINEQQAAELARLVNSSAVRKMQEYFVARAMGKALPVQFYFTPAEEAELKRFDFYPSARALNASKKQIDADMKVEWRNWIGAYTYGMFEKTLAAIAHGVEAINEADAKSERTEIKAEHIGISYLDKMVELVLDSMFKIQTARRRLDAVVTSNGFVNTLKPERLVSQRGITEGNAILDDTEAGVERFLREVDDAIKEREEGIRKLDFPGKASFMRGGDQGMAELYTYMLKFGESQRRIIDIYRRYLALAESRLGEAKAVDGRLLFRTDDDVKLAIALGTEYDAALAEARELAAQRKKRDRELLAPR